MVDSNPKALSANDIIQTLNNKFWSLNTQGLLSPSEGSKLDTEGPMDGLNLDMKIIVESQERGYTGGSGQSQYGKL